MTVTLALLALLMAAFALWLFSHSFNVRPWLPDTGDQRRAQMPAWFTAPRVGLAAFLAAATSLFTLTVSAYLMRMEMAADWRPVPGSTLLWFNTAVMVLASVALQRAWGAARQAQRQSLERALLVGGALTALFVVGQLGVWRQLVADGHYLTANPANAFFYLLTALHGLHLLGGLVAWARVVAKLVGGAEPAALRASVELCALYWHFLLLVWVVLFGLLLMT